MHAFLLDEAVAPKTYHVSCFGDLGWTTNSKCLSSGCLKSKVNWLSIPRIRNVRAPVERVPAWSQAHLVSVPITTLTAWESKSTPYRFLICKIEILVFTPFSWTEYLCPPKFTYWSCHFPQDCIWKWGLKEAIRLNEVVKVKPWSYRDPIGPCKKRRLSLFLLLSPTPAPTMHTHWGKATWRRHSKNMAI